MMMNWEQKAPEGYCPPNQLAEGCLINWTLSRNISESSVKLIHLHEFGSPIYVGSVSGGKLVQLQTDPKLVERRRQ
jgi:hypothetical protein